MAQEEEQLAITVIAKLTALEQQMAKASGITARAYREMSLNSRKATKQMEQDAIRSAARINQAFASVGNKIGGYAKAFGAGLVARVSLQGAQQLIDSATRIQNALKVAGLEGAELTKVYDRIYQAAQKNAAPLEPLVTLYGRASLVQKDLKASTEDMLNFTDKIALALRVSGQSAEETSGALLQLSQLLGSGAVRAEEFNSVQEGALPILQAVAAGLKEAAGSVSRLRSLVIDGKVSSEAFFRAFEAGASILEDKVASSELTVSQGFVRLQNVLVDTAGKLNDTTGASEKVGQALNTMATIVQGVGGIVRNFADSDLGHLAGKLYEVLNPISELIDKIGGVQNLPAVANAYAGAVQEVIFGVDKLKPTAKTPDQILREQLAEAGKGSRVGAAATPEKSQDEINDRINQAFSTGVKPISLADYAVPASDKKKAPKKNAGSKTHSKTADQQIDDDIQSVKDRTAALAAETAAVGMSYQEGQKRKISLELEQVALAKLRDEAIKKGQTDLSNIQISSEQRAQIDAVSGAYAKQVDELRKVQEQQERVDQVSSEFYEATKGGLIDAITGAESLSDALTGILKKLEQMLLNSAFDALFQPSTGGSSGGTFGNIFSSIGSLITGKFATGTNFAPGGLALVGEKGPEIVDLPRGSKVIPNSALSGSGRGAGMAKPSKADFQINVNGARGNAEIREMVQQGVSAGLEVYDRHMLPDSVKRYQGDQHRRG